MTTIEISEAIVRLGATYGKQLDDERIREYVRALSDLSEGALRYAIDEAIRRERWYPTPAVIRGIAGEYRAPERQTRYVGGEPVTDCPVCGDTGTVLVVSPGTMRALRAGDDPVAIHWTTCVVACTCAAGEPWRRQRRLMTGRRVGPLAVYDAARMCRVGYEATGAMHPSGLLGAAEKRYALAWLAGDDDRRAARSEWRPTRSYEEVVTSADKDRQIQAQDF